MFSVPHTVELGLGGSLISQIQAAASPFKYWKMTLLNGLVIGTAVEQFFTPQTVPVSPGFSTGDTLTIVGAPLLNQASALPEGGMAIRLNGSSQYLASVYNETSAPEDIGPQTLECVVTIHALPGVGEEPAVFGGSAQFAITARDDGRIRGYYNGVAVVDLAFALDVPLHVVLSRSDLAPDQVNLWVNGVNDSASVTNATIRRGHLHLGRHWSNAHFLEATYSLAAVHGGELSPLQVASHVAATQWTDVAAEGDVGNGPLSVERGIRDASPLARVAASGLCTFSLNNAFTNSAELTGYYSPGHTNQRAGFGIGIPVRVSLFGEVQFLGRIASIRPIPGVRGSNLTEVLAADILNDAARFRLNQVPILEDVRSDEVFAALVAQWPNQPAGLVLHPGSDVYDVALDNSQDEAVSALEEFVRLAQSEFGRIYVSRIGTLVHESRDTRAGQPLALSLDDFDIESLEVDEDTRDRLNRIETTVHPRVVDVLPTTVLFAIANALEIPAGETTQVIGQYRIASVPDKIIRVGGLDLQPPAPVIDYLMNTLEDGSGADLTASLSVVASYGANGVAYRLTNTSGSTGFVTKLQARGRGIYDFRTLVSIEEDAALVAAHGVNALPFDMPYQEDPSVGELVAARILASAAAQSTRAKVVTLRAFEDEPDLPQGLLAFDVSDRIAIAESVSGVNGEYFIDGVRVELDPGAFPRVTWWVRPPEEAGP